MLRQKEIITKEQKKKKTHVRNGKSRYTFASGRAVVMDRAGRKVNAAADIR